MQRTIPPDELKAWWTAGKQTHGRRWFAAAFVFNQLRDLKTALVRPRVGVAVSSAAPIFRWINTIGTKYRLELDHPITLTLATTHRETQGLFAGDWICVVGEKGQSFRAGSLQEAKARIREILTRAGIPADLLPNA